MKKTTEYLEKLYITQDGEPKSVHDSVENILDVFKQIQIDAIEETCRVCADNADLTYVEYEWCIPEGSISTGDSEYGYSYIDKQSILSVADKLISNL